jgi:hypothetical protein
VISIGKVGLETSLIPVKLIIKPRAKVVLPTPNFPLMQNILHKLVNLLKFFPNWIVELTFFRSKFFFFLPYSKTPLYKNFRIISNDNVLI